MNFNALYHEANIIWLAILIEICKIAKNTFEMEKEKWEIQIATLDGLKSVCGIDIVVLWNS